MDIPSTKPYLIRAIHQWCCDNGFTPYIAVLVDERTRVPREFVREGQIVLNIGYDATGRLSLGNDAIEFQARFGGVARELYVPIHNVAAIYARENGAGMAFELDDEGEALFDASGNAESTRTDAAAPESEATAGTDPDGEPPRPPAGRPRLHRVK